MKILIFLLFFSLITVPAYAVDLRYLSNEICKDAKTDEEKIVALREAVSKQMKPNGNGYTLDEALKMSLEEMWENGVGWCNHQVSVYMFLAREQGLSSQSLYLLTKDKHSSPHTIAETRLGNRWVVVDVGNNLEFRNKYGELATRNDMGLDFSIVQNVLNGHPEFPTKEKMEIYINDGYLVKVVEP